MLYLLYIYLRDIAFGNFGRIITAELIVSTLAAFLYAYGTITLDLVGQNILLGAFVEKVLSLAGIGLGACLTAVTMAVRLADADFADFLATEVPSASISFDAVLFKLSWTAVINWITLTFGTFMMLFSPTELGLFDPILSKGWRIAVAVQLGLFLYGTMLLFVTILTISVLGVQRWRWRERQRLDE